MKHTRIMVTPAALIAALAFGAWSPGTMAAQPAGAASESKPSQEELQKKLDEARAQLDKSAREVAELSMQLGGEGRRQFRFQSGDGPPPRAVIGVQIANGAGEGGAKVVEVSPGGAAADAGIKAGDVITSIGGEDISKESDPGRALVARMAQVDPNLKVQVGVLREGKKLNFDVTPRPAPMQTFRLERRGPGGAGGPPGAQVFTFPGPGPGVGPGPGMPGGPGMGGPLQQRREIIINRGDEGGMGMRFRGIEFATLSEKLGSYFGVKAGVLVVRAGNNAAFRLQDGDVILSIDSRTPGDAQHAGRILRSYSPGEKLTIRVQRDRKAQNLEITVPGGGED
ncbi:MAG: PDZ domain-containing protein [Proteobacteria bacterium]|nr:PDZ domain-containing protein [Pseudomonadota bacterium]